jgi:hypothetical protein
VVAGLVDEGGDVFEGGWVGGDDDEGFANADLAKGFFCAEDGEGAAKAG